MTPATAADWPGTGYRVLRDSGRTIFSYVPDAGHRRMIELAIADPGAIAVPLTSEEEGVAVTAGACLGLAKGVLLMQSSGVGNCVNFFSLIQHCRFPFLTLVTMRGGWGEQNPWQYPMGRAATAVLEAMGFITLEISAAPDVEPGVRAAVDMADSGGRAVAVLLTQRLLGAKSFL
jgi:sulfopyruvate decarboxylase TPP-binding subunit